MALWCCLGEVTPQKAAEVLEIAVSEPFECVIFYRELIVTETPEVELGHMIVEAMPEAERKHICRFFAGRNVFERAEYLPRSIAQLIDEVSEPYGLVKLSMADDSPRSRLPGSRMVFEGLRRVQDVYLGTSSRVQEKAPVLLISPECESLIETIPSLGEDDKDKEQIAFTGERRDAIWQACLNAFTNYPLVRNEVPIEVKRTEFINRALTPTGRHMNHLRFNEITQGLSKRGRKR